MAKVKTPSKINLYLKITGKREDSYHTLESFFMPLDEPADMIEIDFNSNEGIAILCDDPRVPCDERNICYKAALHYAEHANIQPAWQIRIEKNIPVAAGMGGGSSDAAAVLNILNAELQKLSKSELAEIALRCGADVPFFLYPSPAEVSGIGELFEYPELKGSNIPLLIVNPKFPISASWAYKNLNPEKIGDLPELFEHDFMEALNSSNLRKLAKLIHNDLAHACYDKFPLLKIIKRELLHTKAKVAEITGSGPTMFAIYKTAGARDKAAKYFEDKYKNMRVIKTQIKKELV